jgi:hypothetical protein
MSNNFDLNIILDDIDQTIGWGRVNTPGVDVSYGPRIQNRAFDPSVTGLASPIGSLMTRRDNGDVWAKDGALDTDWYQIGGGAGSGAYYCFVWRPGVMADFENVYGAWADLYAAASAIQGKKLVVLDTSELGSFVMDGVLDDLQQFDFVNYLPYAISVDVTGTWLSLPARVSGEINIGSTNLVPIFTETSDGTTHKMLLTDGATLGGNYDSPLMVVTGTGGAPFEGPHLIFTMDRNAGIAQASFEGVFGPPPLRIIDSAGVTTYCGEGSYTLGEILSAGGGMSTAYIGHYRADANRVASSIPTDPATVFINDEKKTLTVMDLTLDTTIDTELVLIDFFNVQPDGANINITLLDNEISFGDCVLKFRNASDGLASQVIINAASINGSPTFTLEPNDTVELFFSFGTGWYVLNNYVA